MGLLDVFKKNKEIDTPEKNTDVEINTDAEQLEKGDILRFVAKKYANCTVNEGSLYFEEHDLTLRVEIAEENGSAGNNAVQLIFIMEHPLFEEEMIESCVGIGKDRNEAIRNGTDSFMDGVLTFVFAALHCDGETEMTVEILGKKATFREPCTRGTYNFGQQFTDNTDLWDLVKDEIPRYIGRKRTYWIKLFASWTGSELVCEARINGVVYPTLTEKLMKKIGDPKKSDFYGYAKQFIVLIQKDETYVPCPYSKDDVLRLTADALDKLFTVNSQERYNEVVNEVRGGCPYKSLGWELIDFIPEIYCQMALGLKDGDAITACVPDSQKALTLRKSQVRSYAYIEEGIFRHMAEKTPTDEENMGVLGASARFNVINHAIMNGAKLENLGLTDLVYAVNEDYEVW